MKSITQMLRLPAICILCNQYHLGSQPICIDCSQIFTPLGPACRHCAQPLPDHHFLICGTCITTKPTIDTVFTAYRFEEPLRSLLHEFKYRSGLYLSPYLATLILHAISLQKEARQTQCLIPIPMHPKRIRQRGYNQAAILAQRLAKILNLPCELSLCKKITNTPPQAGLNAKQRKKNILNTFQTSPIPYHHITLIDDLLTTGSTANELARMFKIQGVARVDLWCCARVDIT